MDDTSVTIFGVDPGTALTGYGIIRYSPRHQSILDYGCIRPPSRALLSARYEIIFDALLSLLQKYRPNAVAVETQFVYKNPASAIKLGMARAMAVLAATKEGIPVYEYPPKRAKQAVTGSGSANKKQVQRMMQIHFQLPTPPEPEDAADALALALCHGHTLLHPHLPQGILL